VGVNVVDGLFELLLGRLQPIDTVCFDGHIRWLETWVNGAPLVPRKPIVSLPYAFSDAHWIVTGQDLYRIEGNIGIGTATPAAKLDVSGNVRVGSLSTSGLSVTTNPGEGRVLTSDAVGNASWQAAPGTSLGQWEPRSVGVVYQATTDGFLVGHVQGEDFRYLTVYSDASNPPSTRRTRVGFSSTTTAAYLGLFCPIRNGDYYKVSDDGTADQWSAELFWISMGN
jgi:hypothetical protein